MTIKKLSDVTGEFLDVVVTDYISKKHYFSDSEVSGWVLVKKDGETELYHMYRRGSDPETHENIDEPLIFIDEKILGEEREREIQVMLEETELQNRTGENKEIHDLVKSFLGK